MTVLDELSEHRLTRPDGRTVAWTEWGRPDGVPFWLGGAGQCPALLDATSAAFTLEAP